MTTFTTDFSTDRLTYLRAATASCAEPHTMFPNSLHATDHLTPSTVLPSNASLHCSTMIEVPSDPLEPLSHHGSKSEGTESSLEPKEDDGWHIVCNVKNSRGKKLSTGFSVSFTVDGPKTLDPTAIPFVPMHLKDLEAPSSMSTSNAVRVERKDDPHGADHGLVVEEQQDGTKVSPMSGFSHPVVIASFNDGYTVPNCDDFALTNA